MGTRSSTSDQISLIIHVVNFAALLLLGIIVLLAGVVSARSVLILLPVLALIILYWYFCNHLNIVAIYFGISVSVLLWILFCENIVTLENFLGISIPNRLSINLILGTRLEAYLDEHLQADGRNYNQQCCDDPLTWNYKPGSKHAKTYDCLRCGTPYEVVVDETGYLNRPVHLMSTHEQIDLFIAGDSVLEGEGVPSVIEMIRAQLPVTQWNLSAAGYGPRQKINVLLTYALHKRPRWLVVEFFSGNDVSDVIVDELCEETKDFRCRFNESEIVKQIMKHRVYKTMLDRSPDLFDAFSDVASKSFTLAVTHYILDQLKGTIKQGVIFGMQRISSKAMSSSPDDEKNNIKVNFIASPAHVSIRDEKWLDLLNVGMVKVHREYERLVTKLEQMDRKPVVILLYNPSGYEFYRDILVPRNSDYDRRAEIQMESLRTFARRNGWVFLDLTDPVRQALERNKAWLYGRNDRTHWSYQGVTFVAPILNAELIRVLGVNQARSGINEVR